MESHTQSADLQTTLAAILASIKNIRDENKTSVQSIRENAIKQYKTLQDVNKKIIAAVHEQSKQNKALLEATEKKISDKVESIRANVEFALEVNNSRISECEARVGSIEERVQGQATTIIEFVSEQEHRFEELRQQINRLQRTSMPASLCHIKPLMNLTHNQNSLATRATIPYSSCAHANEIWKQLTTV